MQWALLAGVSEREVERLLSVARRRCFGRREIVVHADDPGDSLHLIVKGRFAIKIMTPVGDVVTIAVRGPGENFGEMALVAGVHRRTASVLALEEAETFAIYKDDVDQLRQQNPSVNDLLFASLVAEVRMLHERLLEALYVPTDRRVLRRLHELTENIAASDGAIEVPLTQEELAELAGTSRATVNRVLRREEKRGTVAVRRGCTLLLDRPAIAHRAR